MNKLLDCKEVTTLWCNACGCLDDYVQTKDIYCPVCQEDHKLHPVEKSEQ